MGKRATKAQRETRTQKFLGFSIPHALCAFVAPPPAQPRWRRFRAAVRPEELIAAPFLIALAVLCVLYPEKAGVRSLFLIWFSEITALYVAAILFVRLLRRLSGGKQFADCPEGPVFGFGRSSSIRDWTSVAAIFVTYDLLHTLVHRLGSPDYGPQLLAIDRALFGETHVTVWLERFVSPAMTDWMSFSYLTFFFYLPVLSCVFDFNRQWREWRILMLAFTITAFTGFVFYVLVPGSPPLFVIEGEYSVDLQGNRIAQFTTEFVSNLAVDKGVFPSLHVAFTCVYLVIAWKFARRWFWVFLPFVLSLWASTLYLRYHYVIDLVAGYALAFAAVRAAEVLHARWHEGM